MFLGFTEISDFQGKGFTESKTSIKEKNGQKRGLRQKEGGSLEKKRVGVFLRRGIDNPMHTMSSQNNLKVTTNFYEKKCLKEWKVIKVMRKNKKHSLKQLVRITYTLEKRVFAAAIFQGMWLVSFQTKWKAVWYTFLCLSLPCVFKGQ